MPEPYFQGNALSALQQLRKNIAAGVAADDIEPTIAYVEQLQRTLDAIKYQLNSQNSQTS